MSPAARARRGAGKGKRPRGRTIVALALVGFVLVAVGVIWRRSHGYARQRELRALEQRRTQLEAERAKLELEIRDLSSRARLAPIAEQRLGMRYPSDSQVVILNRRGDAPAGSVDGPR
jgi:cell division protein FtsL